MRNQLATYSSEIACAVTITGHQQAELLPVEEDLTPIGNKEVAGQTLATLVLSLIHI